VNTLPLSVQTQPPDHARATHERICVTPEHVCATLSVYERALIVHARPLSEQASIAVIQKVTSTCLV